METKIISIGLFFNIYHSTVSDNSYVLYLSFSNFGCPPVENDSDPIVMTVKMALPELTHWRHLCPLSCNLYWNCRLTRVISIKLYSLRTYICQLIPWLWVFDSRGEINKQLFIVCLLSTRLKSRKWRALGGPQHNGAIEGMHIFHNLETKLIENVVLIHFNRFFVQKLNLYRFTFLILFWQD